MELENIGEQEQPAAENESASVENAESHVPVEIEYDTDGVATLTGLTEHPLVGTHVGDTIIIPVPGNPESQIIIRTPNHQSTICKTNEKSVQSPEPDFELPNDPIPMEPEIPRPPDLPLEEPVFPGPNVNVKIEYFPGDQKAELYRMSDRLDKGMV